MVVTNKVESSEDTSSKVVVCESVTVVDCIVSLVDVVVAMSCVCSSSEVVLGRESDEVVVERGLGDVVVGSSLCI